MSIEIDEILAELKQIRKELDALKSFDVPRSSGEFVNVSGDTMTGALNVKAEGTAAGQGITLISSTNTDRIITLQDSYSGDRGYLVISAVNVGKILLDAGGSSFINGGNLGLGTSSPDEKLQVSGAIKATGGVTTNLANSITLSQEASGGLIGAWGPDNSTKGTIAFYLSTSLAGSSLTAMTIANTGMVGIGTTTIPSMLTVAGLINMKNYTVATLPAGTRGDVAYVTDALLPSFLTTVAGGGAVVVPVFFDGANWKAF